MARHANKKRRSNNIKVGDLVLVSTKHFIPEGFSGAKKLFPKFSGPFKVSKALSPVTFTVELPEPIRARKIHNAFHTKMLRPFSVSESFGRSQEGPPSAFHDADDPEYEVETILKSRKRRGRIQYLVHWKGYPDSDNSWVSEKDLHADDLLQQFNSRSSTRISS